MNKFILTVFAFIYFLIIMDEANAAEVPKVIGQYKKVYHNVNHQIYAVENYNITKTAKKQLLCTEKLNWNSPKREKLNSRTLEDSTGTPLISQAFQYDELGRLAEEIQWEIEDGSHYTQHTYYYNDEKQRLRKTTVAYNPDLLTSNNITEDLFNISKSEVLSESFTFESEENSIENVFNPYGEGIEIGYYGEEKFPNVRISYINGILNSKKDIIRSLEYISETHGDTRVHFAFKQTCGWTWDLLQASLAKTGYICPHAYALATLWKSLIAELGGPENGGTIVHYAHSVGATHTQAAKSLLTPEEQQMIQVYTFGSPTMVVDEGFQSVTNYVSAHDWVTYFDMLTRLEIYFSPSPHVIYIDNGNSYYIPFSDHILEGDTYGEVMEGLGRDFILLHAP